MSHLDNGPRPLLPLWPGFPLGQQGRLGWLHDNRTHGAPTTGRAVQDLCKVSGTEGAPAAPETEDGQFSAYRTRHGILDLMYSRSCLSYSLTGCISSSLCLFFDSRG